MSFKITIPSLFLQVPLTFAVLLPLYMGFAISDIQELDFISFTGLIILQPVFGLILSTITILICLIIGLPIRLNNRLKTWWTNHSNLPIIGMCVSILLICFSFLPSLKTSTVATIDGSEKIIFIPNLVLIISGWSLMAFSIMHYFPKKFLFIRIR